jgi:hypothetical protein
MSKIMLSEPTGLGGACSKGASLRSNIVVIPHVVAEQIESKYCDRLKYVHKETDFYKNVKTLSGKSERFVQNSCVEEID